MTRDRQYRNSAVGTSYVGAPPTTTRPPAAAGASAPSRAPAPRRRCGSPGRSPRPALSAIAKKYAPRAGARQPHTPRAAATAASNAALSSATPSPLAPWSMTLITVRCAWTPGRPGRALAAPPSGAARVQTPRVTKAGATHFPLLIHDLGQRRRRRRRRRIRPARSTRARSAAGGRTLAPTGAAGAGAPRLPRLVLRRPALAQGICAFFLPLSRVVSNIDHPWAFWVQFVSLGAKRESMVWYGTLPPS